MSVLASLVKAYDRLERQGTVPPFGFSSEKIGFVISLNDDGSVATVVDLRSGEGKRKTPRMMEVPASFKRPGTVPKPFFLWDNTAFALGVTAAEGKNAEARIAAFRSFHQSILAETDDPGLKALRLFLESWTPDMFAEPLWSEEMKDQNVVFALESERRQDVYLHDRPAAKALWAEIAASSDGSPQICLVSGTRGPVARLHPAIKGVWGAQSSGASIISFNLDAFTSYGHSQGDNAPVSELAAFKYTAALNALLASDKHRLQIGDSSTVFWADASDAEAAEAEGIFMGMFNEVNETTEAQAVGNILKRIRQGVPLKETAPHLTRGVRFYVLGLAPNAARLSIRFWFEDDFGRLAENYQRFAAETAIEPPPRDEHPPLWRYLSETAVLGKRENVPPNLAGEWMRAILAGGPYPLTLLSTTLMRIRADKQINALRTGLLKAVLIRNFSKEKEAPVSLDPDNKNKGYLLGRLFAAYEQTQTAALGRNVNATIKDKFYGAASVQPRKVFHLLDKGSANHLSKVGKQKPGLRVTLEKTISGILEAMNPSEDPFPASLSAQEQALFSLGYYHQRTEFFRKPEIANTEEAA